VAVDLEIKVKLDSVRKALAEVPEISKKEARQAVRALDREFNKSKFMGKNATKHIKKQTIDLQRNKEDMLRVAANTFGGFVNDIDDVATMVAGLGSSLMAVPPPALAAAAAVATLTAGLVAAAAAVAAYVAGIGLIVAGYGAAFMQLQSFNEENDKFRAALGVNPEMEAALARLENFNNAIEAIQVVFRELVMQIAVDVSPEFERLGNIMAGVAAYTLEAFQQLPAGFFNVYRTIQGFTFKFAKFLTETLVAPLAGFVRINKALFEGLAEVGAPGARAMADALEMALEPVNLISDAAGNAAVDLLDFTFQTEAVSKTLDGLAVKGEFFTQWLQMTARDSKEATQAVKSTTKAVQELGATAGPEGALVRVAGAFEMASHMAKEADKAAREMYANQIAAEAELATRRKQTTDLTVGLISATAAVAEAAGANAQQLAAAKLIETIAFQAVAVARAFAEGGPIAGAIGAAAAISAIAPQIAAVAQASGQSAPGAGAGAGAPTGMARGGGDIVERRGEFAPIVVVNEYRHQAFDAQVRDAKRRRGSPLRDRRSKHRRARNG
jgi:hypothetical protein